MHSFKKILLSITIFLLIFLLLSALLIVPFLHSEMVYYQDSSVREQLAGQIDLIAIGASNGLCAIDTSILDDELECNSYNLSGALLTLGSRDFLLRKEISRNPVKTVIIDLSYETLTRDESTEYAQGDCATIARLSSFSERMNFMRQHVRMNDWLNMYSHLSISGMEWWLSALTGHELHNVDALAKGFYGRESNDIFLSKEEAKQYYNIATLNTDFREDNISYLLLQIDFCKQQGIHVILAVIPKSDRDIWKHDGQDDFLQKARMFAKTAECPFYDMNLLKERYDLWSDHTSVYDETHMSAEGAAAFTKAFCDIIKKAETEDVSQYFYSSYEEMKADSPYMQYLK